MAKHRTSSGIGIDRVAVESIAEVVPEPNSQIPVMKLFWVTFLVIFVSLVFRRPDFFTDPQFWAEDGTVFFTDQLVHARPILLFRPYMEYFLVVPRLIAYLSSPASPGVAPYLYIYSSITISALCLSAFVLPGFRYLLAPDLARAAVAWLCAVAVNSDELVGNVANLQWYLSIAALLLVIYPWQLKPYSLSAACAAASVLLVVLSCPQAVILVPIVIWRIIRHRDGAEPVLYSFTLGIALQVGSALHVMALRSVPEVSIAQTIIATGLAVLYRGIVMNIMGYDVAQNFSAGVVSASVFAACIALVMLLIKFWRRGHASGVLGLVCSGLMAVSIYLALSSRGMSFLRFEVGNTRYFYLSGCLFVFLVFVAASHVKERESRMVYFAAAFLLFGYGLYRNYRIAPVPNPNWQESANQIAQWKAARTAGLEFAAVDVPVTPSPFHIRLPALAAKSGARLVGHLDSPVPNAQVEGEVLVRGWALADSGVDRVTIYVNQRVVGEARIRLARPDLVPVYPDIKDAGLGGFEFRWNSTAAPPGEHRLCVHATIQEGPDRELACTSITRP